MFVQVIEGRAADAEGLRRQFDRWKQDVRPGAVGFLGSTGGVAADGRVVMLARFESADAARANAERPEQSAWWAETEKCFEGQPSFADSEDVQVMEVNGDPAGAGFVQIMRNDSADRSAYDRMDSAFDSVMKDYRPDLLAVTRVWTGPSSSVEAAYFTSEADARANETREPPAELAEQMGEMADLMAGVEFIDLTDPLMV